MTTPDFEDWLNRQDIPVEDTVTLDRFLGYLEDELGIHGGSLGIAEETYTERYKGLEEYGIRAVARHYTFMGEPFVETRYAIKGELGLFGKFRAYEIGAIRARVAGDWDAAEALEYKYGIMEKEPERRKVIYQERS